MASTKNITMKEYNGVDYDTLYPKTVAEQVVGIYSKDETLTDEVASSYGFTGLDAIPNNIFQSINSQLQAIKLGKAIVNLIVKTSTGNPLKGIIISGIKDTNNNPVKTNASGRVTGFADEGTVTLSVNYGDIEPYSESFSVKRGQEITKNITLATRNFIKLTSSQQVSFSENVNRVDVTVVGGGGGPGGTITPRVLQLGGGAGGYCIVKEKVSFSPFTNYNTVIGAGGDYEQKGGNTSFLGITAEGGGFTNDEEIAAIGNGNGGTYNGPNGKVGGVQGYSSFTETVIYGGGGGAIAGRRSSTDNPMEYSKLGKGGGYGGDAGNNGTDGFGGGAGGHYSNKNTKGGSGCVAIRMHLNVT